MPIVVSSTEDLSTVLGDIKDRLNKTLDVDDAELGQILDAAVAEYVERVGPLSGTVTEKHSGGGSTLILRDPRASVITAAAYSDGTAITLADLDLDTATGIVHWGYDTAGAFTYGTRNVTITYTVSLPDNHREAIVADVAGYFAATQRGASTRASFPSEAAVEAYDAVGGPITLFPRIRDLARSPSIA